MKNEDMKKELCGIQSGLDSTEVLLSTLNWFNVKHSPAAAKKWTIW